MTKKPSSVHRIGLDARFFRKDTAGLGRYMRELIKHLAAIDQQNEYVVFLTPEDFEEWELQQPNFRPVVVPAPHYSSAEQTVLLKALRKEKCDLVHFLNFNHPLFYTKPFVTTLHDLTMYFFPAGKSQTSRLRRIAFITILKHALQGAKKVIAISECSALDAEKHLGIPQAKMEVIYEGGPELLELPFGSKAMVQNYLGTRTPYFLFVSQWRPHKGILTLIDAFNKFKKRTGLPHQLVLLGKQKVLEDQVKEALAKSPYSSDIITPGFAPEELLPALYANSVACLVPSEYEGFGLPVLEAFQYKTPVIAANNSSLPEVVGEAGLFFPTRDAEALSLCMERIIQEEGLAGELVEKGLIQAKKFSWAKMAQRTLAVYLNILEKKRKTGNMGFASD